MPSKVLFVIFAKKACRRNHALRYAIDLHRKGHVARIILEGPATWAMKELSDPQSEFAMLFLEAKQAGLVAGACKSATSRRCSGNECSDLTLVADAHQIPLLDDIDGHSSIEPFVRDGYQVIVF